MTVRRLLVAIAILAIPLSMHADTCPGRAFHPALILQNYLDNDFNSWMHQVGVGDFNGDGHPDVVAANFNGVFLLVNAGVTPPQFNPEVKLTSGNIQSLAIGDVNGDGKLDIVVTDYGDNLVKTLIGNGDGTFIEHSFTLYEPIRLVLADMNGDGKLDIVVMNSFDTPTLSEFPGNGDGTYGSPLSTPIVAYVQTMAIADLDGDGHADVITGIGAPSQIEIRHGIGDGTLGAPTIISEPSYVYSILAADLDGDGHIDLAFSNVGTKTVSILRNDGIGGFESPVTLGAPAVDPQYPFVPLGAPQQLLAGDFLGKGRLDLAMIYQFGLLNVYPSNGDGTFGTPGGFLTSTTPLGLAAIDYNGDGRLDLAIANGVEFEISFGGNILLIANVCPTTTTTVLANPTLGTSNAPVTVQVAGHGPTGTVTLREGSSVLAANAASASVSLTVSLPAGDHSLVADYSGDSWNQPSTSDPLVVHVTNATTSISLAIAPNPTTYDVLASVTPTVTSSTGDTPAGTCTVTVDGASAHSPPDTPVGSSIPLSNYYAAGTHTVQAQYNGDATHPPSTSPSVTLVVNKSTQRLTMTFSGGPVSGIALLGSPETAELLWSSRTPTGLTTLREGSTILGTTSFNGMMISLPAGMHTVTASFPGDANYTSATAVGQLAVIDGTATNAITAYYNGQQVLMFYNAVPGATAYRINRLGPAGVVQFTNAYTAFADSTVVPNAAYTYTVQAFATSVLLQTTLSDVVSTATFTDEALVPGTPVRAVHFTELKAATDRLRALANLPPMTFKDGMPAPGAFIRASQVTDLRNAINAARIALGVPQAAWSDATLTPGATSILATHVQELRNALR